MKALIESFPMVYNTPLNNRKKYPKLPFSPKWAEISANFDTKVPVNYTILARFQIFGYFITPEH